MKYENGSSSSSGGLAISFLHLVFRLLYDIFNNGHNGKSSNRRSSSGDGCNCNTCTVSIVALIQSFTGPHFPAFRLNANLKNSEYEHFSRSIVLNFLYHLLFNQEQYLSSYDFTNSVNAFAK